MENSFFLLVGILFHPVCGQMANLPLSQTNQIVIITVCSAAAILLLLLTVTWVCWVKRKKSRELDKKMETDKRLMLHLRSQFGGVPSQAGFRQSQRSQLGLPVSMVNQNQWKWMPADLKDEQSAAFKIFSQPTVHARGKDTVPVKSSPSRIPDDAPKLAVQTPKQVAPKSDQKEGPVVHIAAHTQVINEKTPSIPSSPLGKQRVPDSAFPPIFKLSTHPPSPAPARPISKAYPPTSQPKPLKVESVPATNQNVPESAPAPPTPPQAKPFIPVPPPPPPIQGNKPQQPKPHPPPTPPLVLDVSKIPKKKTTDKNEQQMKKIDAPSPPQKNETPDAKKANVDAKPPASAKSAINPVPKTSAQTDQTKPGTSNAGPVNKSKAPLPKAHVKKSQEKVPKPIKAKKMPKMPTKKMNLVIQCNEEDIVAAMTPTEMEIDLALFDPKDSSAKNYDTDGSMDLSVDDEAHVHALFDDIFSNEKYTGGLNLTSDSEDGAEGLSRQVHDGKEVGQSHSEKIKKNKPH